jgi:hypothetical protein
MRRRWRFGLGGLLVATAMCVAAGWTFSQKHRFDSATSRSGPGQRPMLQASPNPVPDGTRPGRTTVTWDTGDGSTGEVYVSFNGGPEVLFGRGAVGNQDAPWINADSSYDFSLFDAQHKSRLVSLEVSANPPRAQTLVVLMFGVSLVVVLGCLCARGNSDAPVPRRLIALCAVSMTITALAPILSREARPLDQQPAPDALEYADAARQMASGKGYVTYVHDSDTWPDDGQARAPRYPPGFSLALLPFVAVGNDPEIVLFASKWFAALYVIAAVVAAWALRGPVAGLLVAGLTGISSFGHQSAALLLSDALAAGLTVLLVPLVAMPSSTRIAIAGFLAGALVLIRLNMLVNLAALALALRGKARHHALLFAMPPIAALLLYQWLTFGSPFKTGYSYWLPGVSLFSLSSAVATPPGGEGPLLFSDVLHGKLMRWTCPCPPGGSQAALPNIVFYPTVLLGLFWIFSPPLLPLIGAIYLWRHRREAPAGFAMWVIILTFTLHLFYFYQAVRFMAPPATLLTIFAGIALSPRAVHRFGRERATEFAMVSGGISAVAKPEKWES